VWKQDLSIEPRLFDKQKNEFGFGGFNKNEAKSSLSSMFL